MLPGSSQYAPPEVSKNGWQVAQRQPKAVDSWHLGVLIYEVFNGTGNNARSTRGKIPSTQLWNVQKQFCNIDVKKRLTVAQLKKSPSYSLFESTMVEVEDMLTSLVIASEDSFGIFLGKLSETREKFPQAFLHYKVLPQMIEALGRGMGGIKSLTMIIQLGKGLSTEEFTKIVSPTIVKMFAVQDRAVRLELLQSMPDYIDVLDKKTVSDKIFPSLAFGFTDSEPVIRENTLKSVIHLMPKLTDRIINGELLRLLAKTQNDQQPEIRANTTILLGRICTSFSTSTRTNVLIAAFARALKDPFVQSRIAALLALSATSDYYSAQDICAKVIGPLAPSLIDKDQSVRKQAAITMDTFMKKIQAQANSMEDSDDASGENLNDAISQNKSLGKWAWGTTTKTLGFDRTSSAPVREPNSHKPLQSQSEHDLPQMQAHQKHVTAPIVPTADFTRFNDEFADDFDENVFDDPGEDDNAEDAWGVDFDSDFDDSINKSNKNDVTEKVTARAKGLSLEPEEGDDDDEDGWGWD